MLPLAPILFGGAIVATALIVTSRPILVHTDVRPVAGKTRGEKADEKEARAERENAGKPLLERWGMTSPAPADGRRRLVIIPKRAANAASAASAAPAAPAAHPLFGRRIFSRRKAPPVAAGDIIRNVAAPPRMGALGTALEDLAARARVERIPLDGPFVAPSQRVIGMSLDLDGADDPAGSARLGLATANGIATAHGCAAVGVENLGHNLYFYWFAAPGWSRDDVTAAIDAPKAVVGASLRQRRLREEADIGEAPGRAQACALELAYSVKRAGLATSCQAMPDNTVRCVPVSTGAASTVREFADVVAARHTCSRTIATVGGEMFIRFAEPVAAVPAAYTLRARASA